MDEEVTLREQRVRKHAFDMFYDVCGYTPSDEISNLLKKEEPIFPEEEPH